MTTGDPGAWALPVTLADVEAARRLLDGVVRQTPVEPNRALAAKVGGPVLLKCENLQRAGSFKIRGAYTRISRLSDAERANGVVAASAGNHAQGVALAAQMLGIKAKVYMPFTAPLPKVQATLGYGADVEFVGSSVDEALIAAEAWAESTEAVLVHPFDHCDVVAGQGTVGLEILEQVPDVATIVVGAGGGGLLGGVATAVRARRRDVSLVGVQAEGAAAYPASLSLGRPEPLESMATMADGIAVGCPGDVPFALVNALVDRVVTVDEELISRALLFLLERAKLVVEPAGAVAVAAMMDADVASTLRPPVVAVLSGGNIDPLLMMRIIRHGMAAAGRYLHVRLRAPDRPGSLASLLALLAANEANVLEVEHVRTGVRLSVDEVEIALRLETRGPDHATAVLAALRGAGYPLQV
jgi:threonine ammonia-lyase medium form